MSRSVEQAALALEASRERVLRLTDVDEAELVRQHSPLMSPLVWDLAHVGQQEEHWLLDAGEPVFRPEVAALYDAFAHPRGTRPSLPLLDAPAARRHLAEVRARVLDRLDASDPFALAMVAQHEEQHVETMLATHQLRVGAPLLGDGATPLAGRPVEGSVLVPAGTFTMGTDPAQHPGALDNELPGHPVHVGAYRIARQPVTNAGWAAFAAAGGYADRRLWSAEGWAASRGLGAPLSWSPDGSGGWLRTRFGVVEAVPPDEPVQHVSAHEADAYARWAGARLPTEAEWEKACGWDPVRRTRRAWPWGEEAPRQGLATLGGAALRPAAVGSLPDGASAYGVEQLLGDVWEWTSTDLAVYPGFRPMMYADYTEPFSAKGYRVLRGGSWATAVSAVRPGFRNWDLPRRRQIFSGLRLAWDA